MGKTYLQKIEDGKQQAPFLPSSTIGDEGASERPR
jgi:hypothetical protein